MDRQARGGPNISGKGKFSGSCHTVHGHALRPELPLYVFAVGSNDAASGYHVYCSNFSFIMETVII